MKKTIAFTLIFFAICFLLSKYMPDIIFEHNKPLRIDAENKVILFQNRYNNAEVDVIYNESCDYFQQTTARDEFSSIMNGKKKILGNFEKSILHYSNIINSDLVILRYRSIYEHYSLIDEFTYKKIKGRIYVCKAFTLMTLEK